MTGSLMKMEGCRFRISIYTSLLLFSLSVRYSYAQEFPKGWVLPVELGQGLRALPLSDPLYLASLNIAPAYTLIEGRLRFGGNLGVFYTSRRLDGLAGPRLAYNLYDKGQILNSSLYNVQLFGEHLWGFHQQKLLGGGVALEVGQQAVISLRAYRQYVGGASATQAWWFQTTVGINLFRKKKSDDPFNP
jgi:hypothetical protein